MRKVTRLRCPPCPAFGKTCKGLLKTETKKLILYECKKEAREMKQRNRVKQLKARQLAYDAMIVKSPELAKAHKRPGSLSN